MVVIEGREGGGKREGREVGGRKGEGREGGREGMGERKEWERRRWRGEEYWWSKIVCYQDHCTALYFKY